MPLYRGPLPAMVLGHFVGPFGSEMKNVPIPPMTFPEDLRNGPLFQLWITNPVAEIEKWATQDSISTHWSGDALQYYNYGVANERIRPVVMEGMVLASAHRPIASGVFISVLDQVRNRILDLALEIEKVAPDAGQPDPDPVDKNLTSGVVRTYNFYGQSNVAIESRDVTQNIGLPLADDVDGLIKFLAASGMELEQLNELKAEIDLDEADNVVGPSRWQRTRNWLAMASTDAGSNAAGNIISAAAAAFLATH